MKHPGTAGLMPVKGTTCGIRPDLEKIGEDTGFDFSKAVEFLQNQEKLNAQTTTQEKQNTSKKSK